MSTAKCKICGIGQMERVHTYAAAPVGEIRFSSVNYAKYCRELFRCTACGHFESTHSMDLSALYSGEYVSANYRDQAGIEKVFQKIINLPPEKSDNFGRVECICKFATEHFGNSTDRSILDVGAGLGIFPYGMKRKGWSVTALDPDACAVAHLRDFVGVTAVHGDFMKVDVPGRFQVISFNKVLEHVEDPISMLSRAKQNLEEDGVVYIELPDGTEAAKDSFEREEFYIDHLHVFSLESTKILAERAGFVPLLIERIREPSSKYTIRCFMKDGVA